jgi:hypothetical protein
MMAKSRQFAHLQQKSLDTLRGLVPPGCPLVVGRADPSGFVITWRDDDSQAPVFTGRYQVVAAWIDGFIRGWINAPAVYVDDKVNP